MMHIKPAWQAMIERILSEHVPDREVVLFGSRAGGTPKPYSDIDLCIMGEQPVPSKILGDIREAFSSSDLPVRVDVIDWATTDSAFRGIISRHHEVIFPAVKARSRP